MSCRYLHAGFILPILVALLFFCTVPAFGITVHLPDRDAAGFLPADSPAISPSSGFRQDWIAGSWSAPGPDSSTGIVVFRDGTVLFTAPAGEVRMQLDGIGHSGTVSPAGHGTLRAGRDRLSIDRGTVTEWYRSGSHGIEQGMTIAARPGGSGPLVVHYTLAGDLKPHLRGETLLFSDTTGPVLVYSGLSAADATGKKIPARLGLSGSTLTWQVDDQNAVYPVTIDPTIAGQTTVLRATPPPAEELSYFGTSVSLRNDTALIGAYNDECGGLTDAGQAFLFSSAGGTWSQIAVLNASDKREYAGFGKSVSFWNDTAVVGADGAYVAGHPNRGQAYVFTDRYGTWQQVAILNASDGIDYANFGWSVSVWNDTVLVGAKSASVGATGGAGQAYIFQDNGTAWNQVAILNATDAAENAQLGYSVLLSNDTALIGAIEADGHGVSDAGQMYIFKDNGTAWNQVAMLNASDAQTYAKFGWSVDYYQDTVVIGSPDFDFSGKANAGQVYLFRDNGTAWNQVAILNATDASLSNNFGKQVSLYRNTTIVGAPGAAAGGTSAAGKAYIFNNSGGSWTQSGTLTLSNTTSQTDASFGEALSLPNETMVLVGASSAKNSTGFKTGQANIITLAEAPPAPVASFSSANVSVATNSTAQGWAGFSPFTLLLTDTSTGTPTSWAWARNNLTHTTWTTFNTSQNARDNFWTGNWSVNLTATNTGGSNISVQTLWVNVSQAPPPAVTGITPATGQNTTTVSITNLAGSGFSGVPTVNLTKAGLDNITATGVTFVSANKLTCSFDLTNRIAGTWNVNVTNPDGQVASLANGFTITNTTGPAPTPTPAPVPTQTPIGGESAPGQSAASSSGGVSIASGAAAGQTVTYTFGGPAGNYPVTIESIAIVPGQAVGESQCQVTRVSPSEAFAIPDRPAVYEGIQINWINPSVIQEATIQFSVKGSWIREHAAGPQDIVMMRQHDLVWAEIPTVFDHMANDFYFYDSRAPGFSNFAVTVRKNTTAVATTGTSPVPVQSPAVPPVATFAAAGTTGPAFVKRQVSPTPTPVPVPVTPEPGFPLSTIALVGAGCIVLAGAGWYVRRWCIRRQNPALFREYD
jgi:PGF-pre-PGF domain-containing protein